MTGLGGIVVIAIIVGLMLVGFVDALKRLHKWYKTGFCNHKWELNNTCSFGQKHWYKCPKCNEKRLR